MDEQTLEKRLNRLRESKVIRDVDEGRATPFKLDQAVKRMEDKIKELTQLRYMDQQEIVKLRRQVEFLIGHDNPGV